MLPINGQYLTSAMTESYRNVSGVRVGTEISVGAKSRHPRRLQRARRGGAGPDGDAEPAGGLAARVQRSASGRS